MPKTPTETRQAFYEDVQQGGLSDIPATIKRMRRLAGLTQEQYAAFVGVDLTTLKKIEQGRANPSLEILNKIAKPFRLTLGFVVAIKESSTEG
jgi:DNA-binding XRE family transcriptional regulator